MNKKRITLLTVVSVLIAVNCLLSQAQVKIGNSTAVPVAGAILELDGTVGGLLLPQVEIGSLTDFAATISGATAENLYGLLVYNKTANGADIPVGVYVWTDSGWKNLVKIG
jgi:hypothetical protein